jgi:rhodanese-related sulfurtransferase
MPYFFEFLITNWFLVLPLVVAISLFFYSENSRKATKLDPQELIFQLNNKDALLIDLRNEKEFSKGKISQAIYVGPDLENCKKEIEKNSEKPIVLFCQNGNKSDEFSKELKKSGTDTFILKGGINSWTADGLPLLD